ncbi:NUDIX domain-containing protein [Jiangella gansuensis]|uniref:NUDIX domain-containing protein n=1 Tax=Jiangella gansuensis TaxID=281473 RepID=UPI000566B8E2|nr:NUDIX hydrolase [Jiangella gansuensis]
MSLEEDVRADGAPEKEFNPGIADRIPRKTVAGGALIRNEEGLILFIKPIYKPTLEIPGGIADPNESPRQACEREILEEIGLDIKITNTLVVDWIPQSGPWHDGVMFIFDGGILDTEAVQRIRIDNAEARDWEFMTLDSARPRMRPSMARRLSSAQNALKIGRQVYAEFGRPV